MKDDEDNNSFKKTNTSEIFTITYNHIIKLNGYKALTYNHMRKT